MTTGMQTGYKQFSMVVPKPTTRVRKGKNLFDLAFAHKDFAVGSRFTRSSWKYPEPCYWTVTSIRPTKNEPDMKRGKAWGVLTWRGMTDPTPRRIRTTTKRDWQLIRQGQEVPTYPLDDQVQSRRYNYFDGSTGVEAELRSTEGAERVYTATLRGVREEVKPRLAPWKLENFTEEEIDEMIANEGKKATKSVGGEEKEKPELS